MKVFGKLETHLERKDERSPFAVLANSIESRVTAAAADRVDGVFAGAKDKFHETETWLEAALREENDIHRDGQTRRRLKVCAEESIITLGQVSGTIKLLGGRSTSEK